MIISLVVTTPVLAQNLIKTATAPVSFSKRDFVDTIKIKKIKVIDGAVVVPVEIEGRIRHFLFDTGSPLGLWQGPEDVCMRQLMADSLLFGDSNKNRRHKTIYQIPIMKMGNLKIENYPMIVEDGMKDYLCGRFDGVLGFNLVSKGLSFKLDTKDSLLIVTDRKQFFSEEEKGQPCAKYRTKQAYRPLDLTLQTDTTIKASAGIYGLSTDTIVGRFLHFQTIKIGELPINDLYATTAFRTMRIGSALLKHASLIIDAPRKRFVFLPHNQQGIRVVNSEAGSISLIPSEPGDTLGVLKAVVRKGSTAYQKGIRTGDYLREVNGIPINDLCTFMLMERKDEEAQLKFHSPDGIEKTVRLKRTN